MYLIDLAPEALFTHSYDPDTIYRNLGPVTDPDGNITHCRVTRMPLSLTIDEEEANPYSTVIPIL